jgi:hypothetical protein
MRRKRAQEGRDPIEVKMREEGQACLRGVNVEEEDAVGFIQFSVCGHGFSGLGGIVNEDDLQFPSKDPFSLIDPFPGI